MTFREEAKQILRSQPKLKVEAFLEAFARLREVALEYAQKDRLLVIKSSGYVQSFQVHTDYDSSDRAKQLDKDVDAVRHLLKRLSDAPEFALCLPALRHIDAVFEAYQDQRGLDRPRGRPRLSRSELWTMWALDCCLYHELPNVGRSFKPGTLSIELAQAILGRDPPSTLRKQIDAMNPPDIPA